MQMTATCFSADLTPIEPQLGNLRCEPHCPAAHADRLGLPHGLGGAYRVVETRHVATLKMFVQWDSLLNLSVNSTEYTTLHTLAVSSIANNSLSFTGASTLLSHQIYFPPTVMGGGEVDLIHCNWKVSLHASWPQKMSTSLNWELIL